MNPISRKRWLLTLMLAVGLVLVGLFAGIAFWLDQTARQSERHDYSYSIDLYYTDTLENVTLLLPVAEVNDTPFFTEDLLNGTAYGLPADWNLSVVEVNGSPMLAIRAERMVPEYHGYPVPLEPGQSPAPVTTYTGTEYSETTPVLRPVQIVVTKTVLTPIETRAPLGQEPVLSSSGTFTALPAQSPPPSGVRYAHGVPIYLKYHSDAEAAVTIQIRVEGINSVWRGGWVYNRYGDSVILEAGNRSGWIPAEGILLTGEGIYY